MKPIIIGYGFTNVGEHWNKDIIDLAFDAASKAVKSAGVDNVDAVYVASALSTLLDGQACLGQALCDELGLDTHAVRIEAGEASGAYAVIEAVKSILSGQYNTVLVGGVEKISDSLPEYVNEALTNFDDAFVMSSTGLTIAGLFGILARLYMNRYHVDMKDISYLAVIDHENAINAPHAQFKSKITLDTILSSPLVADPLRLFDTSPLSDGAAFIVLSRGDQHDYDNGCCVEIAGFGSATQPTLITEREDPLFFKATNKAFNKALKLAGISLNDINIIELHDSYTIAGVLALEALNIYNKGEAARNLRNGRHKLSGDLPINTFGGLKARGHPVGATGIYQIIEVTMQLLGAAGKNQVNNVKYGAVHSMNSADTAAAVIILGKRGD